jgi:hypothetical protein
MPSQIEYLRNIFQENTGRGNIFYIVSFLLFFLPFVESHKIDDNFFFFYKDEYKLNSCTDTKKKEEICHWKRNLWATFFLCPSKYSKNLWNGRKVMRNFLISLIPLHLGVDEILCFKLLSQTNRDEHSMRRCR